jgi:hypothetical protein
MRESDESLWQDLRARYLRALSHFPTSGGRERDRAATNDQLMILFSRSSIFQEASPPCSRHHHALLGWSALMTQQHKSEGSSVPGNYLNLVTYLSGITVRQKESGVRTPLSLLCGFRFTANVPQQEPSHRGDVPSDELPRSRADEVAPPILHRAKYNGGHPRCGNQAATPIQGGARGHNAQQPE